MTALAPSPTPDGLPEALARVAVALVASVALHLGLVQLFGSLPAGSQAPTQPARLTARLAPIPNFQQDASSPAEIRNSLAPSTASSTVPPAAQVEASATAVPRQPSAPAANLVTLPSPRYLRSNEVDEKPGFATAVVPQYPEDAMHAKQRGRLILRLLINEKGGLDNVTVLEADPAGVFDDSALAAFRNAGFVPGKLAGENVKTQLDLELSYVPGETTAVRTESNMSNGVSVQQIRQGPLPWPYRKPASARNSDQKN